MITSKGEKDFKWRLRAALSPFLEMLEAKKEIFSESEWEHAVRSLQHGVINSPDQYFKGDLPERTVFIDVISSILQEFLEDQVIKEKLPGC